MEYVAHVAGRGLIQLTAPSIWEAVDLLWRMLQPDSWIICGNGQKVAARLDGIPFIIEPA
jgi:hypothetical protein